MFADARQRLLHNLNLVLYVLFLLFAVSLLWSTLVEINSEVRAVKAEQSSQYAFLEQQYPAMRAAAGVMAVLSVVVSACGVLLSLRWAASPTVRRLSSGLNALYAASILAALVFDIRFTAAAGLLLFLLYVLYEAEGAPDAEVMSHFRAFHASLATIRARGVLRFLTKIALIFALSGALVLVAEALFHTGRFAGRYFSREDFHLYLAFGAAGGAILCAGLSLAAFGPVALLFLASRLKTVARSGLLSVAFALTAPIWFAFAVGGIFNGIIYAAFGGAIADLKLEGVVLVLSFLLGFLLLMTSYVNFKFILKETPQPRLDGAGEYAVYVVVSMLAIPLFPLLLLYMIAAKIFDRAGAFRQVCALRRPAGAMPMMALFAAPFSWLRRLRAKNGRAPQWLFLPAGLASAGLLLFVFGEMNYPPLKDYGYVAQGLYSIAMTGAAICALFILSRLAGFRHSPRLRFGLPALGAVMALSFFAWTSLETNRQLRMIMNEYAAVGRTAGGILLGGMGPDEEPQGDFSPYGARHAALPADTGIADFSAAPPPIIYIILDAARPDRMRILDGAAGPPGIYRYRRDTTPRLREFAADAVVFTNARSPSTSTIPAMRGLLSGRFAPRTISDRATTGPFFTNDLFEIGYRKFFIKNFSDDRFMLGMDDFLRTIPPQERSRFAPIASYDEKGQIREALQMIREYEEEISRIPPQERGYFVYLHFLATHFPWRHYPREEGVESYGDSADDMYDEDMEYADRMVGEFLDGLKQIGAYDKSVIIVSADHGTALGEHGNYAAFLPYEEQQRIPLFIRIPGVGRRVVEQTFTGHDLAPTLINLFRRGVPNRFDGVSFLPVISGRDTAIDREYVFNIGFLHDAYTVIQDDRWKLIYHRDRDYWMLYDLANDPCETSSLADRMPEKCAELMQVLKRFLWAGRHTYANPRQY